MTGGGIGGIGGIGGSGGIGGIERDRAAVGGWRGEIEQILYLIRCIFATFARFRHEKCLISCGSPKIGWSCT